MNGANLGYLVFCVLLLQYINIIYLLALKKAMKHCDFMTNIKIFGLIPIVETDTIVDPEICLISVAAVISLLLCLS